MKVVKSYTGTTSGVPTKYISFEFDTGHKMTRYQGGSEFFQSPNNRPLRASSKLVEKMRNAARAA